MRYWPAKQQEVVDLLARPYVRAHLIDGPRGCGKDESAFTGFLDYAQQMGPGLFYGLSGPTDRQIQGRLVPQVYEYAEFHQVDVRPWKHGLRMGRIGGGRPLEFMTVPLENIRAERRVRSSNFQGLYVTEFPLCHPSALDAAYGNLRGGSMHKLVATGNPEGPGHFAMTDWIDKAPHSGDTTGRPYKHDPNRLYENLPLGLWDNPEMTQEYVDALEAQYSGSYRLRMVEGVWAVSTGAVWPGWREALGRPPKGAPSSYQVWVDVGRTANPTHAVLVAVHRDKTMGVSCFWVVGEWRWDPEEKGPATFEEQVDKLVPFMLVATDGKKVNRWIIDPSANAFRLALQDRLGEADMPNRSHVNIVPADPSVDEGIERVDAWARLGRLRFARAQTPLLASELDGYVWDANAAARGLQRPLKTRDHGPDAVRYGCQTNSGWEQSGPMFGHKRRGKLVVRQDRPPDLLAS